MCVNPYCKNHYLVPKSMKTMREKLHFSLAEMSCCFIISENWQNCWYCSYWSCKLREKKNPTTAISRAGPLSELLIWTRLNLQKGKPFLITEVNVKSWWNTRSSQFCVKFAMQCSPVLQTVSTRSTQSTSILYQARKSKSWKLTGAGWGWARTVWFPAEAKMVSALTWPPAKMIGAEAGLGR